MEIQGAKTSPNNLLLKLMKTCHVLSVFAVALLTYNSDLDVLLILVV